MLVAVGNGPSFGGGLRITHGASIDDGWLDVVVIKTMSKLELVRTFPEAVQRQPHPASRSTSTTGSAASTVAAPGIVAYADGERLGALPMTVEVRAAGAVRSSSR